MSLNRMVTVPSGAVGSSSGASTGSGSSASGPVVWRWADRRAPRASQRASLRAWCDMARASAATPRAPLTSPLSTRPRTFSFRPLLRTVTPPMIGKARTLTRGAPGVGATSRTLRSLPPMMGTPVRSTSMPSGTTMSIPPMKATAGMTISGPSSWAWGRWRSPPPMNATALVWARGRQRPVRRDPLMMATVHPVAGRRAVSGTGACTAGRSSITCCRSACVRAAQASPTRSENSSSVRRPSAVWSRRSSTAWWRSASDMRTTGYPSSEGGFSMPSVCRSPGLDTSGSLAWVDRALGVAQRRRPAPGMQGDDLGGDRDGRLFRGAGADVEPDGAHHPGQVLVGGTRLPQPFDPFAVRAPRAHGADVAGVGGQGGHEGGDVELGVVSEHADCVARTQILPDLRQVAVGPVHHDLVGHREPGLGGEDGSGVAHGHPVPQQLRHPGQGGGEVHGADDHHARRRRERLHEDGDLALTGFAV